MFKENSKIFLPVVCLFFLAMTSVIRINGQGLASRFRLQSPYGVNRFHMSFESAINVTIGYENC